ncbi:5'-methylthioadenosine/adenosylhomocysteine nucleosidase [Enterococcus sp. DIV0242_7C1]|uniref:5'-methylthioadenosine/S-adenosylhomocysteine nucleosidase n=1 Tax=Candidatus Enterococcus dunnyi TaxID=1834192 RepID=A0A200JE12_9ENTE|nr:MULTISPECIES: 5'-methylthioadenosine/adenosylhomocysteine nucleosidase [unclassified Enterococcus]MBO0469780.1 5'-methylthioadenosine/adenosylhomocysteine nucleosidase [Enterococcus sp. DIV0242_7C1]MCA5011692.1 5'-methylthioadenosine/adenosylhomocysteine nucleosidase [Enterococcus sp. S23]MCA5014866.1 5'-methylthioadenosine/adenosylhomocysteine nucleosidase [Enterococcus sp. S22(2020)]OUZ34930.1 MTA/SAH nucleosidase [Enterococcus sp. 9D6_DIV0238]
MKIGIIGAMDQEVKILKEKLSDTRSWERAGALFVSGSLGRHEVIVVRSGIGKVLSAVTTTLLIHQYGVNMVINTGSAGGIGSGLKVGDVVISDKLAYFDVDVTGFGYAPGQLPGMPLYYECSEYLKLEMKKAAEKTGMSVRHGLIVTGDSFVNDKVKVQKILQDFPEALACEMEGASIAQAAAQFKIPFLVVRAISDTADHEASQTFDEFIEEAGEKSAQMVIHFVEHLV